MNHLKFLLDIEAIRAKLNNIRGSEQKDERIWKPKPGNYVIRILDYKHQPGVPIIVMKFHYNFNGKTYTSPASINQPDPLIEFSEKLLSAGHLPKDEYIFAKSLEPKNRYFVPIVVRGEEEKGVQFLGMGENDAKIIGQLMMDEDWSNLVNLENGHDIGVEVLAPRTQKNNTDFVRKIYSPKPKQTVILDKTDPNYKSLMEDIKNMPALDTIYQVADYETLKKALEQFLSSPSNQSNSEETETAQEKVEEKVTKQVSDNSETADFLKDVDADFAEMFKDESK